MPKHEFGLMEEEPKPKARWTVFGTRGRCRGKGLRITV